MLSVSLNRQQCHGCVPFCTVMIYADDTVAIFYVLYCDVSAFCALLLLLLNKKYHKPIVAAGTVSAGI